MHGLLDAERHSPELLISKCLSGDRIGAGDSADPNPPGNGVFPQRLAAIRGDPLKSWNPDTPFSVFWRVDVALLSRLRVL